MKKGEADAEGKENSALAVSPSAASQEPPASQFQEVTPCTQRLLWHMCLELGTASSSSHCSSHINSDSCCDTAWCGSPEGARGTMSVAQ